MGNSSSSSAAPPAPVGGPAQRLYLEDVDSCMMDPDAKHTHILPVFYYLDANGLPMLCSLAPTGKSYNDSIPWPFTIDFQKGQYKGDFKAEDKDLSMCNISAYMMYLIFHMLPKYKIAARAALITNPLTEDEEKEENANATTQFKSILKESVTGDQAKVAAGQLALGDTSGLKSLWDGFIKKAAPVAAQGISEAKAEASKPEQEADKTSSDITVELFKQIFHNAEGSDFIESPDNPKLASSSLFRTVRMLVAKSEKDKKSNFEHAKQMLPNVQKFASYFRETVNENNRKEKFKQLGKEQERQAYLSEQMDRISNVIRLQDEQDDTGESFIFLVRLTDHSEFITLMGLVVILSFALDSEETLEKLVPDHAQPALKPFVKLFHPVIGQSDNYRNQILFTSALSQPSSAKPNILLLLLRRSILYASIDFHERVARTITEDPVYQFLESYNGSSKTLDAQNEVHVNVLNLKAEGNLGKSRSAAQRRKRLIKGALAATVAAGTAFALTDTGREAMRSIKDYAKSLVGMKTSEDMLVGNLTKDYLVEDLTAIVEASEQKSGKPEEHLEHAGTLAKNLLIDISGGEHDDGEPEPETAVGTIADQDITALEEPETEVADPQTAEETEPEPESETI